MTNKKEKGLQARESAPVKRGRGRPRLPTNELSGNTVQALERGLLLLLALSKGGNANLTNLALQVGMPPSTALRLLTTMQKHGFVDFDETSQHWAVGVEAYSVGSTYLNQTNLVEVAQRVMRKLMNDTGETTNLAIEEGGDIVFVAQVETQNPIRAFHSPGSRGKIHASGIGKIFLSELPREGVEKILQKKGLPEFTAKTLTSPNDLFENLETIRSRGWSFDDEERFVGMRCIAAAIYDATGTAVAGLSVSGPTVRFPDTNVPQLGAEVVKAATEITRLIGGLRPHPIAVTNSQLAQ
ncbi:MAG: IclR family acetate operon transcriptional repressor [Granulosicoccus sp.]|jgi:IclR family acetate operon transcriptional repressor